MAVDHIHRGTVKHPDERLTWGTHDNTNTKQTRPSVIYGCKYAYYVSSLKKAHSESNCCFYSSIQFRTTLGFKFAFVATPVDVVAFLLHVTRCLAAFSRASAR